jgi:adenine-specific DNA-methyltransferase
MARKKSISTEQKLFEQYEHKDKKRLNNPPVGLVDAHTDNGGQKKKTYSYDPHLDPQLQWAGKAEHTSFEVPTVSLHVHERIDPRKIIEIVRKEKTGMVQPSLFEEDKKPLREAIEFYKHKENWSNRLIAGDSLLVMNSLLEKEGMGGKVQMVYFDPPYGIKYKSNFQPFVNKRDVSSSDKDEDLTAEPEMIKAFRDTWELGIHSYLTYLRDRLLLARELLTDSGSVFVQISDENVHHVKELMDEVYGQKNFISIIPFRKKTMPLGARYLERMFDFIICYSKDSDNLRYHQLYQEQDVQGDVHWGWVELPNGERRRMSKDEIRDHLLLPSGAKIYRLVPLWPASFSSTTVYPITFSGKIYSPPKGLCWITGPEGIESLIQARRIEPEGEGNLRYVYFLEDYPLKKLVSMWDDTAGARNQAYVVQTSELVIQRCLLMTTDPGDLVLDITCGSGTTAYVAENWGRRWMTCDTSRVAITLAKQRLMTANFDYFELAHPDEGVSSGFKYKTVPHITLKSIANNEPAPPETLYDQPFIDSKRLRVTGPFTMEAVPAPVAKSFDEVDSANVSPDAGAEVARSGETLRQSEWRDELLRTGVRAKGGKIIEFSRVEAARGLRYVQAEAETKEAKPQKVYVVFGPEHAPLEQRTVELAYEEVKPYKPDIILFCALQFDEEAAKDIDEMNPEITRCLFLKAQMNADLLTDDLKKKRSSNESFWLIGQPDVKLKEIKSVDNKGKYQIEVNGFDYYNPKTGNVESGGKGDIAMWLLDTDYDGRSLFPSQVFFPMAGAKEGWATIARNLKTEIDEEKIESFSGTVSLPFVPGKAVAVKIIDARGIESLKIIRL